MSHGGVEHLPEETMPDDGDGVGLLPPKMDRALARLRKSMPEEDWPLFEEAVKGTLSLRPLYAAMYVQAINASTELLKMEPDAIAAAGLRKWQLDATKEARHLALAEKDIRGDDLPAVTRIEFVGAEEDGFSQAVADAIRDNELNINWSTDDKKALGLADEDE
jgi:hypothetical protein